jgi:hypothetical protein
MEIINIAKNISGYILQHAHLRNQMPPNLKPALLSSVPGDSFYASLSLALYGNESRKLELRIRSVFELIGNDELHKAFMLKHQSVMGHLNQPEYDDALVASVSPGGHASFWHASAAATVLQRSIKITIVPRSASANDFRFAQKTSQITFTKVRRASNIRAAHRADLLLLFK